MLHRLLDAEQAQAEADAEDYTAFMNHNPHFAGKSYADIAAMIYALEAEEAFYADHHRKEVVKGFITLAATITVAALSSPILGAAALTVGTIIGATQFTKAEEYANEKRHITQKIDLAFRALTHIRNVHPDPDSLPQVVGTAPTVNFYQKFCNFVGSFFHIEKAPKPTSTVPAPKPN